MTWVKWVGILSLFFNPYDSESDWILQSTLQMLKQFATHALKQLSESDRISLKANLNILFDEK
jgi:hypothetical protein